MGYLQYLQQFLSRVALTFLQFLALLPTALLPEVDGEKLILGLVEFRAFHPVYTYLRLALL